MNELEFLYTGIGRSLNFPLIKDTREKKQEASAVLVTKILLGVFGNTPAMDEYFIKGFEKFSLTNSNYLQSLDKVKKIWTELEMFYNSYKELFDSYTINSLSFDGSITKNLYTKAKLLDMLFFEKGLTISKAR